jgi:hypothetical protein
MQAAGDRERIACVTGHTAASTRFTTAVRRSSASGISPAATILQTRCAHPYGTERGSPALAAVTGALAAVTGALAVTVQTLEPIGGRAYTVSVRNS